MALDEGDGGLGGLDHILLLVAAGGDLGLGVHVAVVPLGDDFDGRVGHLFPDDDVRAHPDGQTHDEAEGDLPEELGFLGKPFLPLLEHLDIVVGETQGSAPQGAEQQQDHVDVGQVAEQQDAREDGQDDDDAAHRRGPFLLDLPLEAEVAHGFSDLVALEGADDPLARQEGEQHRRHHRHDGAEGQVMHQSHSGDVDPRRLEVSEQVVNHFRISLKVSVTISFSSK